MWFSMYLMSLCTWIVVLLQVGVKVSATNDMNEHELQLVSDHLTKKECNLLYAALLHEEEIVLRHAVNTSQVPKKSCIELLLDWDRNQGRDKNSIDLIIRLKQLGRKELADKLSLKLDTEKADQVIKSFLSDPFKKFIHKDSPLLDEAPKDAPRGRHHLANPDPWTKAHFFGFFSVVASMLVIAFVAYKSVDFAACCQKARETINKDYEPVINNDLESPRFEPGFDNPAVYDDGDDYEEFDISQYGQPYVI